MHPKMFAENSLKLQLINEPTAQFTVRWTRGTHKTVLTQTIGYFTSIFPPSAVCWSCPVVELHRMMRKLCHCLAAKFDGQWLYSVERKMEFLQKQLEEEPSGTGNCVLIELTERALFLAVYQVEAGSRNAKIPPPRPPPPINAQRVIERQNNSESDQSTPQFPQQDGEKLLADSVALMHAIMEMLTTALKNGQKKAKVKAAPHVGGRFSVVLH